MTKKALFDEENNRNKSNQQETLEEKENKYSSEDSDDPQSDGFDEDAQTIDLNKKFDLELMKKLSSVVEAF